MRETHSFVRALIARRSSPWVPMLSRMDQAAKRLGECRLVHDERILMPEEKKPQPQPAAVPPRQEPTPLIGVVQPKNEPAPRTGVVQPPKK